MKLHVKDCDGRIFWCAILAMAMLWALRLHFVPSYFPSWPSLTQRLVEIAIAAACFLPPIFLYGLLLNRFREWRKWYSFPTFRSGFTWLSLLAIALLTILELSKYHRLNMFFLLFVVRDRLTLPALAIIVSATFLEETIFRGFVLAECRKMYKFPIAIVLTTALYALAHLSFLEIAQNGFRPYVFRFFTIVALGVILALMTKSSQSLWSPIAAHALYNVCLLS